MSKSELLERAAKARALAAHGRRLVRDFKDAVDRGRARQYIDELEAQAASLEAEAAKID